MILGRLVSCFSFWELEVRCLLMLWNSTRMFFWCPSLWFTCQAVRLQLDLQTWPPDSVIFAKISRRMMNSLLWRKARGPEMPCKSWYPLHLWSVCLLLGMVDQILFGLTTEVVQGPFMKAWWPRSGIDWRTGLHQNSYRGYIERWQRLYFF